MKKCEKSRGTSWADSMDFVCACECAVGSGDGYAQGSYLLTDMKVFNSWRTTADVPGTHLLNTCAPVPEPLFPPQPRDRRSYIYVHFTDKEMKPTGFNHNDASTFSLSCSLFHNLGATTSAPQAMWKFWSLCTFPKLTWLTSCHLRLMVVMVLLSIPSPMSPLDHFSFPLNVFFSFSEKLRFSA